jgi:hypothetical protein
MGDKDALADSYLRSCNPHTLMRDADELHRLNQCREEVVRPALERRPVENRVAVCSQGVHTKHRSESGASVFEPIGQPEANAASGSRRD